MGAQKYNCKKVILYPPKGFLKYNFSDDIKESVEVDACLKEEIADLWEKGIKTCGCCCGHGCFLGFIQVKDECLEKMIDLGYVQYIYPAEFGGTKRKDAFVPKTYGHEYGGYTKTDV